MNFDDLIARLQEGGVRFRCDGDDREGIHGVVFTSLPFSGWPESIKLISGNGDPIYASTRSLLEALGYEYKKIWTYVE